MMLSAAIHSAAATPRVAAASTRASCHRAASTDIIPRQANAGAATGGKIAPHAIAREVGAWRRIFGRDARPVAFEFLGHELCKAGLRPLAHLGARGADHHHVVRLDHYPGGDLAWRGADGLRRCGPADGRRMPTANPPAATAEPPMEGGDQARRSS